MTRGRELPLNSKVRRRLFQDDPPEPYPEWDSHDHLSKVIKTEYIARTLNNQLILKGMKWNFDFQAERSLRGNLKWYRKGNSNEWVMMEPTGRSIFMRKRSREPLSGLKFTYEEERRPGAKKRRLSPHTVALRRGFFTDGRVLNMALSQAEDENFTNEFNDDPPPEYSTLRGYDRPPWYTEDESEEERSNEDHGNENKDEPKHNEEQQEVQQNTSNNNENKDGVETDEENLPDTNYPLEILQIIDMGKDANDNQEPSISEDNFEKLHIDDNDTDIKEQNEEEQNDFKNKNEATPKNEKNKAIAKQKKGKAKSRARNGKARKKLHNSRY